MLCAVTVAHAARAGPLTLRAAVVGGVTGPQVKGSLWQLSLQSNSFLYVLYQDQKTIRARWGRGFQPLLGPELRGLGRGAKARTLRKQTLGTLSVR